MDIFKDNFVANPKDLPTLISYPTLKTPTEYLRNFAKNVIGYIVKYKSNYKIVLLYCGTSGAIITMYIRELLEKYKFAFDIYQIGKESEIGHKHSINDICSGVGDITFDYFNNLYIIVDDFVSSGATVRRINEVANLGSYKECFKILFTCRSRHDIFEHISLDVDIQFSRNGTRVTQFKSIKNEEQ